MIFLQLSIDIFTAVFALLIYYKEDVFQGICAAASLGGDTDTIGALYGALAAAFAHGHNIPSQIVQRVTKENNLHLDSLSEEIQQTFWV